MSYVIHFVQVSASKKLDLWHTLGSMLYHVSKLREQEGKLYEKTRLWANETAPD